MHLFGHWARDKGLFDLATAIRKVTSDPADVYGIIDRGRLIPGAWADMILFDPETISITKMERHFDLPAGLHAGPITYKLRPDSKQYLIIAPGGHVGIGSKLGDYVIAYTLPEHAQ